MRIFLPLVSLLMAATSAFSHEFWISPEKYQVSVGGDMTAELRVGQDLKGGGYAYLDFRATRFDTVIDGVTAPVTARNGDRPAFNMPATTEGLVVVVHETTDSILTYKEWEKFQNFTKHKDFVQVQDEHLARGLPKTGFKESYRRHAKSLIAVGAGQGADAQTGMETEIVAVTNPYTDDLSTGMVVDVYYKQQLRGDVQVELFEKAPDGTVTVAQYRTDANGRAVLPITSGHEYLVDAVVMRNTGNDDPAAGPVWHSAWASLTFRAP